MNCLPCRTIINEQHDARTMLEDTCHTTLMKIDVVSYKVKVSLPFVYPSPIELGNHLVYIEFWNYLVYAHDSIVVSSTLHH